MTAVCTALFFFCCLLGAAFPANAAEGNSAGSVGSIIWQLLEPGLELARVPVAYTPPLPLQLRKDPYSAPTAGQTHLPLEGLDLDQPAGPPADYPVDPPGEQFSAPGLVKVSATILRIDPERFSFSLYMASESGYKTLAEIAESENFVAAINAGMYQLDHSTSTGYLRSHTHTNNPRVASGFGAFFVAGPLDGASPQARLLDRHSDDWQSTLKRYGLAMQNYRMTAPGGKVIWRQTERTHSIAALSQDAAGRILFIMCVEPVSAKDFMAALLLQPLGADLVMYLEGGSEAALLINSGGMNIVEGGRHLGGFWGGSSGLMLPNVLGIRRSVGAK